MPTCDIDRMLDACKRALTNCLANAGYVQIFRVRDVRFRDVAGRYLTRGRTTPQIVEAMAVRPVRYEVCCGMRIWISVNVSAIDLFPRPQIDERIAEWIFSERG